MTAKKFSVSMPPGLYRKLVLRARKSGIGISTQIQRDLDTYWRLLDQWHRPEANRKVGDLTLLELERWRNEK